jgi:hypothetical protein
VILYVRVAPLGAVPKINTSLPTLTVRAFAADHDPLEMAVPSTWIVAEVAALVGRTLHRQGQERSMSQKLSENSTYEI